MEVAKQVDILLALFGASVIVVGIAAVLLVFFIVNKKREFKRRVAEEELKTTHQQELLYNSIETQERERKRIARDLHDEIGTLLSVMRMNVSQVEWYADNREIRDQYTTATKSLIDKTIENTRRISHQLLPESLEMLGLYNTLENFCNSLQHASGINVIFTAPDEKPELSSEIELGLYRICSELINNSIKHSGCDEILLDLQVSNSALEVQYRDNGRGYSPATDAVKEGLGLKNMVSRAQMMGAEINFAPTEGEGFEMKMHLSLTT